MPAYDPKAFRCLMTPEMHRERAAELRRRGTENALKNAQMHELAARMIEKRFNGAAISAPPLAPV
jgi:hypothetical protein